MKKILVSLALTLFAFSCFSASIDDLTKACMKGDLAGAQKAIDAGADVNGKDAVGWQPIGAAILSPEITKLLLDHKANADNAASGALVNAAGLGSYEVVKLLLDAGADPNKPFSGVYAIQNVINRTLSKECLEILIAKGANTKMLNSATNGNLLDDLAASALPPADWIVNNKAQVAGWEKMGFALPEWYKNPDVKKLSSADDMIKLLVKAGVDINAENKIKNTPLLTALAKVGYTKPDVILAFINNGSNVNVEGFGYKGHALLQASGLGFPEVLEAMFAKGVDMNMEFKVNDVEVGQTLKGITPLMWAARNGKLEAVKYLAGKGAKLNESASGTSFNIKTQCLTKVSNKSAIYYAVEGENLDVVKFLVESTSGDWKAKMEIDKLKHSSNMGFQTVTTCFDNGDYSASAYAKACQFPAIADYLKSKKL